MKCKNCKQIKVLHKLWCICNSFCEQFKNVCLYDEAQYFDSAAIISAPNKTIKMSTIFGMSSSKTY